MEWKDDVMQASTALLVEENTSERAGQGGADEPTTENNLQANDFWRIGENPTERAIAQPAIVIVSDGEFIQNSSSVH